jgi:hypothetical protein
MAFDLIMPGYRICLETKLASFSPIWSQPKTRLVSNAFTLLYLSRAERLVNMVKIQEKSTWTEEYLNFANVT